MTDSEFIKKELRNEIASQKSVSRSARSRKCGSKSKKAAVLPSDWLTPKQWREKNGEVITVHLNQPMLWKDFKVLPEDLQRTYLDSLVERFGCNLAAIAGMFGVTTQCVRHGVTGKIGYGFKKSVRMTDEQKAAFSAFLGGETCEAVEEVQTSACKDTYEECVAEELPVQLDVPSRTMNMREISVCFSGTFNPDQIANTLRMMIASGAQAEISVYCRCQP